MNYPFKYSDAGRSGSRRPKQSNDCTVRALAIVCGIEYDQAYDLIAAAGRKSGKGFYFREFIDSKKANGFMFTWMSFPAIKGETRMNPVKFCQRYTNGRYIIKTARNVAAVIDGVLYDVAPERSDRCVYGAWNISACKPAGHE